jgi:hypothetical protein
LVGVGVAIKKSTFSGVFRGMSLPHLLPLNGFSATRRIASSVVAVASFLIATGAAAEVNPFVSVGGATFQTIREEQDLFLNPLEVEHWQGGWEFGVGISAVSPGNAPSFSHPQWEARIRLNRMGGELKTVVTDFARTQAPFYSLHAEETFEYSGWMLSPAAIVRLHSLFGIYAAPTIQRLAFEGHEVQDWEGDIPIFFPVEDSEGTAKGTLIYGSIEVGTRFHLIPKLPSAGIELYWVPKRVQMSSTQESNDSGYVANFAKLHSSVGARLTYDF